MPLKMASTSTDWDPAPVDAVLPEADDVDAEATRWLGADPPGDAPLDVGDAAASWWKILFMIELKMLI